MARQYPEVSNIVDIFRNAVTPLSSFGKDGVNTVEKVWRRNYQLAGDCLELGVRQLRAVSTSDGVGAYFRQQKDIASDFAGCVSSYGKSIAEMLVDAQNQFTGNVTSNLRGGAEQAAQKVDAAATAATAGKETPKKAS